MLGPNRADDGAQGSGCMHPKAWALLARHDADHLDSETVINLTCLPDWGHAEAELCKDLSQDRFARAAGTARKRAHSSGCVQLNKCMVPAGQK